MNKREKVLKEIAEVINRNSLEVGFNDTPDYILADVALSAIERFAVASQKRDDWHGFKDADKKKLLPKAVASSCKGCPFTEICPAVKMDKQPNDETPNEVEELANVLESIFPGSQIEIQRIDLKKNPWDKCHNRNKRNNGKGGNK